jgi:hypothetical protein
MDSRQPTLAMHYYETATDTHSTHIRNRKSGMVVRHGRHVLSSGTRR